MAFDSMRRLLSRGYRYVLGRSRPYGLVSWRFLLPGQSRAIQTHRVLLLQGFPEVPRPLWYLLNAMLWLRWVLFSAWRSCIRIVRLHGSEVEQYYQVPQWRQFFALLRLALLHAIPPQSYYQRQLFLSGRDGDLWACVYDAELPTYHFWASGFPARRSPSLQLLGDKRRHTEALKQRGLPVAEILAFNVRQHRPELDELLAGHGRLFCKPNVGNQGRGAFMLECTPDGNAYTVCPFPGHHIATNEVKHYLRRQFERADYLIQPCYTNHPLLAVLTDSETAITLRLITRREGDNYKTYCGYLEIPQSTGAGDGLVYCVVPVDLDSGKLLPAPESIIPRDQAQVYLRIYQSLSDMRMPCWQEINDIAITAHDTVPDIHAVAWDFIISPDGPKLLEGNFNWRVSIPQSLLGGLLR